MKIAICLLLTSFAALAQFTPIATPTSQYTSSTTVIPITPPNFTTLSSVTDGTQTISFSSTVTARTVPAGGWATWGAPPNTESSTPRVVSAVSATTLTLTLSVPSRTFGFEIEPNNGTFSISAAFMNGATTLGTITQNIVASSGALLAAASSSSPITSVVITAPAGAGGFAIAQMRYGATDLFAPTAIPTLSTTAIGGLGMLLAAAGALLARRQQLV